MPGYRPNEDDNRHCIGRCAGKWARSLSGPAILFSLLACGLAASTSARAQRILIENPASEAIPPDASAGLRTPWSDAILTPETSADPDPMRLDRRLAIASAEEPAPTSDPVYGPPSDRLPRSEPDRQRYNSFGSRAGTVKWELAGFVAALTAINLPKDIQHGSSFHFHNEGLFGHDTDNIGVDKLAHAYNIYVFSDILYARMKRKTGGGFKSALTSGLLALGLAAYSEVYDGFEDSSGWSMQDVGFDILGAGFSVLRNSVPGLSEKLDYRLLLVPNRHFYTHEGKEHFRQQHFLLSLKLAGFDAFHDSPLRFVELQAGYYARGFTPRERARGEMPQRKPFIGIGINVGELLFGSTRSPVWRATKSVLNYIELPYTAIYAK